MKEMAMKESHGYSTMFRVRGPTPNEHKNSSQMTETAGYCSFLCQEKRCTSFRFTGLLESQLGECIIYIDKTTKGTAIGHVWLSLNLMQISWRVDILHYTLFKRFSVVKECVCNLTCLIRVKGINDFAHDFCKCDTTDIFLPCQ